MYVFVRGKYLKLYERKYKKRFYIRDGRRITLRKNQKVVSRKPTRRRAISSFGERRENMLCRATAKFSSTATKKLRKLTETGKSQNHDGKITQKEMAGALTLTKIGNKKYVITLDRNRRLTGKEEEVSVARSRFNYHSHPREAYIRHGVDIGWASGSDFEAFVSAFKDYGTQVHCVATLEGIYVLTMAPYWLKNSRDINLSSIKKVYEVKYPAKDENPKNYPNTGREFVVFVNKIKYKKHSPLFKVFFMSWNEAERGKSFSFYFLPLADKNCLISESD
uniref:Uncharacterized protein n=1 Tax=Iridovirus LCIVAC01 TaxID=2506607 RepID=A0A481YR62_9VIRU|nr:MAG: hypothetical protein LCIVAC01_00240 [Iridovirus LCIVAC01]